jgi:uncharacterized protein HemX
MKKLLLSLTMIAFIAGTVTTSFGQVQEQKKEEVVVKKTMQVAQKDSVSEYQKLIKDSDVKFKSNEKSIADLRVAISKLDSTNQASNLKNVSALEQKNTDLKKVLADYKVEGQTDFTTFQKEFTGNLDLLSKELKEYSIKEGSN